MSLTVFALAGGVPAGGVNVGGGAGSVGTVGVVGVVVGFPVLVVVESWGTAPQPTIKNAARNAAINCRRIIRPPNQRDDEGPDDCQAKAAEMDSGSRLIRGKQIRVERSGQKKAGRRRPARHSFVLGG